MNERTQTIDEQLRATQVGDTVRMRIEKASVTAEVRDRISPVLRAAPDPESGLVLAGFTKDPAGEWDLDSMTGAKDSPIVEIVVRRIAASI